MPVENPAHFGDGERMTVHGMAGLNHQFRLDVIQMSARILDDTVVVFRDRTVASHRDDGICGYSRRPPKEDSNSAFGRCH